MAAHPLHPSHQADQTENILKGQTETSGVVLEWIIDARHGNVTISNSPPRASYYCTLLYYILKQEYIGQLGKPYQRYMLIDVARSLRSLIAVLGTCTNWP